MTASTRPTHAAPKEDCLRKRRYPSKRSAKWAARHIPGPTNVYQCPHCGGWHLARRRAGSLRVDGD